MLFKCLTSVLCLNLLVFIATTHQLIAKERQIPPATKSLSSTKPANIEKFFIGFYIYPYHIKNVARQLNREYKGYADALMNKIASDGFNLIYISNQDFDYWLELAEKYNLKIIVQIDSAYLASASKGEVEKKASVAIKFINKYIGNPRIIAYSIVEEPSMELMPFVEAYYEKIRSLIPNVPLYLLHNNSLALKYPIKTNLTIVGTDRYAFWGWDPSAGGYAATPSSALLWYYRTMQDYSNYAETQKATFAAVFTTIVQIKTTTKEKIRLGVYGNHQRIYLLAKEHRHGWNKLDEKRFCYVKYYRPPKNSIRAMVWLSILNGAKIVLHWPGTPTAPNEKKIIEGKIYENFTNKTDSPKRIFSEAIKRNSFSLKIFNPDLSHGNEYEEYRQVNSEIQKLAWIINRLVSEELSTVASVSSDSILYRIFTLPGINGKILFMVNSHIGKWDSNSVHSLVNSNKPFEIDALGNLPNYEAASMPDTVKVEYSDDGELWNVRNGQKVGDNGKGEVIIAPGDAGILYIGNSKNFEVLMRRAGLEKLK